MTHTGVLIDPHRTAPLMRSTFLRWLSSICKISNEDLILALYIHKSGDLEKAKNFWIKHLNISNSDLKIYYKKHKITKRRNIGENYKGLIRIIVKRSTDLNRKIDGWIEGINKNCGVV